MKIYRKKNNFPYQNFMKLELFPIQSTKYGIPRFTLLMWEHIKTLWKAKTT